VFTTPRRSSGVELSGAGGWRGAGEHLVGKKIKTRKLNSKNADIKGIIYISNRGEVTF